MTTSGVLITQSQLVSEIATLRLSEEEANAALDRDKQAHEQTQVALVAYVRQYGAIDYSSDSKPAVWHAWQLAEEVVRQALEHAASITTVRQEAERQLKRLTDLL